MTRKECLDKAAECVLKDRNNKHGKPEDSFETIAMMWSAYLGKIIQGWDVAAMMALLKIARIKANPAHADNWCDLAGYAACGAECRQKFEAEMAKIVAEAEEAFPYLKPEAEGAECASGGTPSSAPKDGDELVVLWKHKPEAEGGCCQSGNDQPKFKHGDRVQANIGPNGKWEDMVYYCKDFAGNHLVSVENAVSSGDILYVADAVRPAPKAEGCEPLVENDAPQTPQELYQHIVDCNPATFGRPRTPTGEELAEMAEEDGNACS